MPFALSARWPKSIPIALMSELELLKKFELTLVPSKRSVRLTSSASVSLPLVRGSPGVDRASRKRIGSPV